MLEFCDTIGILYAGRLCEFAPAQTLFNSPAHPYTKGLLNSSPDLLGTRQRMEGIEGSPPDMMSPPDGCRYHPRCPEKARECKLHLPRLVELVPQHFAACLKAPFKRTQR